MQLVIIALVCSQLATPDPHNCVVDSSIRHQRLDLAASNDVMCEFNGMAYAANVMHVDTSKFEYVKVLCVRPSVEVNGMPG